MMVQMLSAFGVVKPDIIAGTRYQKFCRHFGNIEICILFPHGPNGIASQSVVQNADGFFQHIDKFDSLTE